MISIATKGDLTLIDKLTRTTDARDSGVNLSAINHLPDTGNKAAVEWH